MSKAIFSVAYNGLLAVYTSSTGLSDARTGMTEVGGGMNVGDYFDLDDLAAKQHNPGVFTGRYRFVRLSTSAVAANVFRGAPCGIALPTSLAQVAITGAGTGQAPGTYTISSSASGGTVAATAQVVIGAAGTVTAATLLNPGAGFTSTPTFTVAAGGTPGTIVAQMNVSENFVSSFDASSLSVTQARGLFLAPVTAAQIAVGAYVFIQELGIASVLVSTATATAIGSVAAAGTGGTVTTNAPAFYPATLGQTIDVAAAGLLARVELSLPVRQG
jgi:hypothetical protein